MTKLEEGDLYLGRLSVLPRRAARAGRAPDRGGRGRSAARGLPGVRLGVRVVLTDNQRLFQSLGYREISREAHEGFDYMTSINMRKALSS